MKSESKRKILVAGMGTSSAVLTNAVWALSHQKKSVRVGRDCDEADGGNGII
ncbi:MAG: hypothetical protein II840_11520 [Kiritimatiellae bacterium]|nr:hypothetical protein [Kiritimatiellia bacterium]